MSEQELLDALALVIRKLAIDCTDEKGTEWKQILADNAFYKIDDLRVCDSEDWVAMKLPMRAFSELKLMMNERWRKQLENDLQTLQRANHIAGLRSDDLAGIGDISQLSRAELLQRISVENELRFPAGNSVSNGSSKGGGGGDDPKKKLIASTPDPVKVITVSSSSAAAGSVLKKQASSQGLRRASVRSSSTPEESAGSIPQHSLTSPNSPASNTQPTANAASASTSTSASVTTAASTSFSASTPEPRAADQRISNFHNASADRKASFADLSKILQESQKNQDRKSRRGSFNQTGSLKPKKRILQFNGEEEEDTMEDTFIAARIGVIGFEGLAKGVIAQINSGERNQMAKNLYGKSVKTTMFPIEGENDNIAEADVFVLVCSTCHSHTLTNLIRGMDIILTRCKPLHGSSPLMFLLGWDDGAGSKPTVVLSQQLSEAADLTNSLQWFSFPNIHGNSTVIEDICYAVIRRRFVDTQSKYADAVGRVIKCSQSHSTQLSLKRRNIQFLPNDILACKLVTRIRLEGNDLTYFPVEFARLPALAELSLADNNIVDVTPSVLGQLLALEILNLSNNKIEILSLDALARLPVLKEVTVKGNPLGGMDPCLITRKGLLDLGAVRGCAAAAKIAAKSGQGAKLTGSITQYHSSNLPLPQMSAPTSSFNGPSNVVISSQKRSLSGTNVVFGTDLSAILNNDKTRWGSKEAVLHVPLFVSRCVSFLLCRGLDNEGILRTAGKSERVNELKDQVDKGTLNTLEEPFFETDENPACVASLFKQYLRELPNPPFPFEVYDKVMNLQAIEEDEKFIEEAKKILNEIPTVSLALIKCMLWLMYVISRNEATNRMSTNNVARVMAPNLLYGKSEQQNVDLLKIEQANDVVTRLVSVYTKLYNSTNDLLWTFTPENYNFAYLERRLILHKKSIFAASVCSTSKGSFEGGNSTETIKLLVTGDSKGSVRLSLVPDLIPIGDPMETTLKSIQDLHIISANKGPSKLCLCGPGGMQLRNIDQNLSLITEVTTPVFACMNVKNNKNEDELWTAGEKPVIVIYDCKDLKKKTEIDIGTFALVMCYIEDSNTIWIYGQNRSISIWNVHTRTKQKEFNSEHDRRVNSMVYIKPMAREAAGRSVSSANPPAGVTPKPSVWTCGDEGAIFVWDPVTGEKITELTRTHNSKIFGVCHIKKLNQVWSYSWDAQICVWDLSNNKSLGKLVTHHSDAISKIVTMDSAQSAHVYSTSWDRSVNCWRLPTK